MVRNFATIIIAFLAANSHPAIAQVFTGDIYPSLSNVEVQNTTTWMQLLSDRLAINPITGVDPSVNGCNANNCSVFREQLTTCQTVSLDDAQPNALLVERNSPTSSDWNFWSQGYGLGGNIAGNSSAGGLNFRLGGIIFGCDRKLSDNLMIGAFGGYGGSTVHDRDNSSTAKIDDYQVGLYEVYRIEPFYITNVDAFVNEKTNVQRPAVLDLGIGTGTTNPVATQWAHYSESGMSLYSRGFQIQPFVGMQYLYLNQQGFTETGADPTNLAGNHQIVNSLRGSVGTRVSKEFLWNGIFLTPSVSARYLREMGDGQPSISSSFTSLPGTNFPISGNYLGRDFGLFNFGGTALVTKNFSFFASFGTQVSTRSTSVLGSGGFQLQW